MKKLILFTITIGLLSCTKKATDSTQVKSPDTITKTKKGQIISCPIAEKQFIKKNGIPTGHTEYYLERSIQDYFIKFCESDVTREEFEKALIKQKGEFKSLTIEMELKEGEWDSCPDDEGTVQSRIGEYAVIYRIID